MNARVAIVVQGIVGVRGVISEAAVLPGVT
jgi:hypothetical protein